MTVVAAHSLGPHTLAEWHSVDQPVDGSRLELLAGWWSVSPAPSYRHQRVADRLCRALGDQLSDLYAVTAVGCDISTVGRDGTIPDVVVITAEPTGDLVPAESIVLLVEVWSPGNRRSERAEKRRAYAEAGVPYFWEVEFDGHGQVELVAKQLAGGVYVPDTRIRRSDGPVTVTAAPKPVTVELKV